MRGFRTLTQNGSEIAMVIMRHPKTISAFFFSFIIKSTAARIPGIIQLFLSVINLKKTSKAGFEIVLLKKRNRALSIEMRNSNI